MGYNPSYSMSEAQKKCSLDDSCLGVYDNYCDSKPPFFLCPKLNDNAFVLEESVLNPPSCVREKQGNILQ